MDPVIKAKLLGYSLRLVIFLLWSTRAIYRSSLASARNGLILLLGYALLLGLVVIDKSYFYLITPWHEIILAVAFCPVLFLCGYLLLGQYCAGVVKIDMGAEIGISFSQSMNKCKKSFRFIGIAAAKLTQEEEAFRLMVTRCLKIGNTPQFILCDPASPVIRKLEGLAHSPVSRFAGKIDKSYTAIRNIENELGINIDIRLYKAQDYDDMPLFRLIFIDDEYCLASGGIYGQADHGVKIPQFLVAHSLSPALYTALDRYYKKAWNASAAWNRDNLRG